jgi:hypothetical protein
MNFQHYLLEKVITGQKTQTRRIKKPGEKIWTAWENFNDCSYFVNTPKGHLKWMEGNTYAAAPGRGKCGQAHIKLLRIGQARACDISEADARAEGFASRDEFLAAWDAINGKGKREAAVWVLTFVRVQ